MNKKEYLNKLESELSSMSYKDVKEILSEIEEHFNEGINNGKSEAEICKDLGSAEDLAKAYLEGTSLPKALVKKQEEVKSQPVNNKGYDVAGVLFVILFNLLVMIPIWFSVAAFLLSIVGADAGLVVGLVALCSAIPTMGTYIATGIVLALLILFIIVFIAVICYFAIKYFIVGTVAYVKWNAKLWKKGF